MANSGISQSGRECRECRRTAVRPLNGTRTTGSGVSRRSSFGPGMARSGSGAVTIWPADFGHLPPTKPPFAVTNAIAETGRTFTPHR